MFKIIVSIIIPFFIAIGFPLFLIYITFHNQKKPKTKNSHYDDGSIASDKEWELIMKGKVLPNYLQEEREW